MSLQRSLAIVILFVILIQPVELCDTLYYNVPGGNDEDFPSSCGSGYDLLNYCMDDDNCPDYSLDQILDNITSNVLINITTDAVLSSIIPLADLANITITGHNNPTVHCIDSGGLQFISCSSINIYGIVWQHCGYGNDSTNAALKFTNSSTITIQNCSFQHSTRQIFVLLNVLGDVYINNCSFTFNTEYKGHGSIIHHSSNNTDSSLLMLSIVNCCFKGNEGAGSLIYIGSSTDDHHYLSLENSTFINNENVLFYMSNVTFHMHSNIVFKGYTKMFICINSDIIFHDNCSALFTFNTTSNATINKGSYIFLLDFSKLHFKENATVKFGDIIHEIGGCIYSQRSSCIIFENNCLVTFIGNQASIIHLNHSSVIFKGNSTVSFEHNLLSGVIYLQNHSSVTFRENSTVLFYANMALDGGIIYLQDQSNVVFRENSLVLFYSNIASNGGVMNLKNRSYVCFQESSRVSFGRNKVRDSAAAIYLHDHSYITFKGYSTVKFNSNGHTMSGNGGAIRLQDHSSISFNESCEVSFGNNNAASNRYGDAAGTGTGNGAAIYLQDQCNVSFNENCKVLFASNTAFHGAAIYSQDQCNISFNENCKVSFTSNIALHGAAIYSQDQCNILFNGNCEVTFNDNKGTLVNYIDYFARGSNGGVMYLQDHCNVAFKDNSTVTFNRNSANNCGGAIYFEGYTNITFTENSTVTFDSNTAYNGGALYSTKSSVVIFKGNSTVTCLNNHASLNGGAYACLSTDVTLTENTTTYFTNNSATENGGAIYLYDTFNVTFNKALVNFSYNSANFGGAILAEIKDQVTTSFNVNNAGIFVLNENSARAYGDSVFFNANGSKYPLGTSQERGLTKQFTTIPYKAVLRHPSIFCAKFNNDTSCTSYKVNNIMLGEVVTISGCVYDYFDNPVTMATQFQVDGSMFYEDYNVKVLQTIHLTCRSTERYEISITGYEYLSNSSPFIYSIILTSSPLFSQWQPISFNLSIQLSPCHLGFQYSHDSQQCECYGQNNIVVCSGSISTIKRGYWFGSVNEKLTVAICPINYCDFSCCETSNGYHQLLPERENQCSSHRTGIACGNCEEGYTLSYSADCVSVNKCTVGWTILVVTLTVLYWMIIVVAVFVMMNYKLPIGYLYAIIYYYSMIDVLLSQDLYFFSSLYTAVIITSSVFKVSPQFLGQFCLAKDLSGIDIQFIHYIHPLAISGILIMISLLAKCSIRLSTFISRGIIHVICCLLLLSYTFIASTSLLLIRSLSFHNVDKVFTYLSPDIEYLHGRHLAYFTVAVLCTIIIVIGLPLLLLLEPFLNNKINFTRIKPLLDQFQGCYKDQYRWFAAYYMICRLILITVIIYPSNYFISQYLCIIASVIMVLVHVVIKPYCKEILNTFDRFLLLLMIVVAQLPLFRSISSHIFVTLAFVLIMLPLLSLSIIMLIPHKDSIKKLIVTHCKTTNPDIIIDETNELPMEEFDTTIDESMRSNATICDM